MYAGPGPSNLSQVVLALISVAMYVQPDLNGPAPPSINPPPSYERITTSRLSLPISPALATLAIIIPALAAINTIILPYLLRNGKVPRGDTFKRYLPLALQLTQLLFTTAVATLLASEALPSPVRDCVLEGKWKAMWTSHDAESIRAIQDALGCCGFRTVKDMAWPFPQGKPGDAVETCVEKYGRAAPCREPWQKAMASAAGGDFGVLVGVVVMQVVGWVLVRMLGAEGFDGVWKILQRLFGRDIHDEHQEERVRPLLGDVEEEERIEYGGLNTAPVSV